MQLYKRFAGLKLQPLFLIGPMLEALILLGLKAFRQRFWIILCFLIEPVLMLN